MRALKEPVWGKDHQYIDCKIRVNDEEWAPFTVSATDKDPKMMAIFATLEGMKPADYVEPVIVPTSRDVNIARDVSLKSGFVFDGNTYQSDTGSLIGIVSAATAAISLTKTQRSSTKWHGGDDPFCWITADNKKIEMTGNDVIELNRAAMLHRAAGVMAGRNIKDMDKIPPDFATHI